MVKIEKHDLLKTTSGAMNRLWKGQEQDFGIDLCWQGGANGNGTILRTKGERHDRYTPKQQAFRSAWCSCDVEYSNLPQSEKEEWRRMARKHGHSTGNNISGYNLFMKYCSLAKYEDVRREFEDKELDYWEPWTQASIDSYEVVDDGGVFESVAEPRTMGAPYSLKITPDTAAFNSDRTWERGCLFSGYIRFEGEPSLFMSWGPLDDYPGGSPEYGMALYVNLDSLAFYYRSSWGYTWRSARHASIPTDEWLFFEVGFDESDTVMFTVWDADDTVIRSYSAWDWELYSGWFGVRSLPSGSGTAYLSPIQLQDL